MSHIVALPTNLIHWQSIIELTQSGKILPKGAVHPRRRILKCIDSIDILKESWLTFDSLASNQYKPTLELDLDFQKMSLKYDFGKIKGIV